MTGRSGDGWRPGIKQRQLLRSLLSYLPVRGAPAGNPAHRGMAAENGPVTAVAMLRPEPGMEQFVGDDSFYAATSAPLQSWLGEAD